MFNKRTSELQEAVIWTSVTNVEQMSENYFVNNFYSELLEVDIWMSAVDTMRTSKKDVILIFILYCWKLSYGGL